MRYRAFVLLAVSLLAFSGGGGVWAQEAVEPRAPAPGALPDAFVKEEKSPFLAGLRRFEIVTFGSFPITLLYTNMGFRLSRYFQTGTYSTDTTDSEAMLSVGIAALLSLGVGAIDAVIRGIRSSRADRSESGRVDSP